MTLLLTASYHHDSMSEPKRARGQVRAFAQLSIVSEDFLCLAYRAAARGSEVLTQVRNDRSRQPFGSQSAVGPVDARDGPRLPTYWALSASGLGERQLRLPDHCDVCFALVC